MRLCTNETYARKYEEVGVDVDKQPVFHIKKISAGEKLSMDDASFSTIGNDVQFKGGTSQRLKLKYGLVSWDNITDESGVAVPCTEESKDKLPSGVALWIINEIDKLNGLVVGISEVQRKNS